MEREDQSVNYNQPDNQQTTPNLENLVKLSFPYSDKYERIFPEHGQQPMPTLQEIYKQLFKEKFKNIF